MRVGSRRELYSGRDSTGSCYGWTNGAVDEETWERADQLRHVLGVEETRVYFTTDGLPRSPWLAALGGISALILKVYYRSTYI